MRSIITSTCRLITAIAFTACSGTSSEGKWIEPVPGMEEQIQGIMLDKRGKASSINMATLQYEKWEQQGNKLLLSGKSIGNNQTISFTDTLNIEELTNNKLVLKRKDGYILNYQKQK